MTRIFIDTDELRDIASDLRGTTGEVGDLLGRLGSSFHSTWMPLGPQYQVREEVQDVQLRVLQLRVHTDAISLDVEAMLRDAEDVIADIVAEFMGDVRWVLHVADGAWDWTWDAVDGPLARLGHDTWIAIKTGTRSAEVLVIVIFSTAPVIDWMAKRIRRHQAYSPDVFELSDQTKNHSQTILSPRKDWKTWIEELQNKQFSYAEYMRVIGMMPPGTVVVVQMKPGYWVVMVRGVAIDGPGHTFNSIDSAAISTRLDWGPYEDAVERAITAAGVPDGAHLMLVGHSQGGIATRNLAADREFTHRYVVDGVLTGGAPVQNGFPPVDSRTHTIAMENLRDPVPKLSLEDGRYDAFAQRGHETDYTFNRTRPTHGPMDAVFDPHSTDLYAKELDGMSGRMATQSHAGSELTQPPFCDYVGHPPVPNGVRIMGVLAPVQ